MIQFCRGLLGSSSDDSGRAANQYHLAYRIRSQVKSYMRQSVVIDPKPRGTANARYTPTKARNM
jgi:hypothetical protein